MDPKKIHEYHVFLSSPGDVPEERQEVIDYFTGFNKDVAQAFGVNFKVLDWQTDVLSGIGRAQGAVTEQLLERFSNSLVLFIGILGFRFGTHTGTHESGTEEEYEWVAKLNSQGGRPEIKWFFRKLPESPALDDQLQKIVAFRNRLTRGKDAHFVKQYADRPEFRTKLESDLSPWLIYFLKKHHGSKSSRWMTASLASIALILLIALGWTVLSNRQRKVNPPGPGPAPNPTTWNWNQLPQLSRLDPQTTSYVYRIGWKDLLDRLSGTPAGKTILDKHSQDFFGELRKPAGRATIEGAFYSWALDAIQEELVFAGKSEAVFGSEKSLHFGLIRPVEAHHARFNELYSRIRGLIERTAPTTQQSFGSSRVTELSANKVLLELGYGYNTILERDNDSYYWANSQDSLHWGMGDYSSQSLTQSATFSTIASKVVPKNQNSAPIAFYYHDFSPSWRRHRQNIATSQPWSELSWTSLDAMAGATFVEGGRFRNRHYWLVGNNLRRGLFAKTPSARINDEWIKCVPQRASGFITGVWSAQSFISTLESAARLASNPDQAITLESLAYLPFAKVLKAIGTRYLLYRVPNAYGVSMYNCINPFVNVIVITEISDPTFFREQLGKSLGESGLPYASRREDGVDIISIWGMANVYLAIRGDQLMISFHPQLFEDALDNWLAPKKSIASDERFARARKECPSDACFLMYFPPHGFADGTYDMYIPQLQQYLLLASYFSWGEKRGSGSASTSVNLLSLPRGNRISQYVEEETILWGRDDGQGIEFDGHAPLLSLAYYWAYFYAAANFNGKGELLEPLLAGAIWLVRPDEE